MNKFPFLLFALPMLAAAMPVVAQKKLKKSDRTIVSNMQAHINFLSSEKLAGRKAGTEGEKLANEYVVRQFTKSGLKPGPTKDWYQTFEIYDGKEIKPASMLQMNEDVLELHKDYFPFPFSGNSKTEAAVAVALAENGVPWFKDIRELLGDADSVATDTAAIIRRKAQQAAAKGASALIVYNKSPHGDLQYNRYDSSEAVTIPVVFITGKVFSKYAPDESAIIDVKLNVALEPKSRSGRNVLGYTNNGADSTVITSANLGSEAEVAALIEVVRLMRNNKSKSKNYVFVTYCGEAYGKKGQQYFHAHMPVELRNVREELSLDSLSATMEPPKGLNLVKRTLAMIQ